MKFNKTILIIAVLVLLGSASLVVYQNKDTILHKDNKTSVVANTTPTPTPEVSATPEITGNTAIDSVNSTVNDLTQDLANPSGSAIENDSSLFNQENQVVNNYDEVVTQNQSL